MINCNFLIFKNCNHCIKELIPLSSGWGCSLNSINALKTKWTLISIERNIGVRFFKPVYIIGGWNDTESLMNGNICFLKCITDIKYTGIESMHSRDRYVDSEESECATGM